MRDFWLFCFHKMFYFRLGSCQFVKPPPPRKNGVLQYVPNSLALAMLLASNVSLFNKLATT